MPKKAKRETHEEQSARFRAEVQRLVEAGELSPIAAEEGIEELLGRAKHGVSKVIVGNPAGDDGDILHERPEPMRPKR
jgi:hypothetical protein